MNQSSIEKISGVVLLLVSIVLLWEVSGPQYGESAIDEGVNPGFLPKILLSIWLVLSLILIFRRRNNAEKNECIIVDWKKFFVFALSICIYFVAVWFIGFVAATFIYLVICPLLLGFESKVGSLIFGLIGTASLWIIFERIFKLVLPSSQIFG